MDRSLHQEREDEVLPGSRAHAPVARRPPVQLRGDPGLPGRARGQGGGTGLFRWRAEGAVGTGCSTRPGSALWGHTGGPTPQDALSQDPRASGRSGAAEPP